MRPCGLMLIRMAIQSCEHKILGEKSGVSKGDNSESIIRLIWALVHYHNPFDVQQYIAICLKVITLCFGQHFIPSLSLELNFFF
jgi:hypothetical protein